VEIEKTKQAIRNAVGSVSLNYKHQYGTRIGHLDADDLKELVESHGRLQSAARDYLRKMPGGLVDPASYDELLAAIQEVDEQ